MRKIILTLLVIAFSFIAINDYCFGSSEQPAIVVNKENARISIPHIKESGYKWNKEDYVDGLSEYEFMFQISGYQIGFILLNSSGEGEKEGHLLELLKSGIFKVWELDGMVSKPLSGQTGGIRYSKENSRLDIIITNSKKLDLLFQDKPYEAIYTVVGFESEPRMTKIKIKYN